MSEPVVPPLLATLLERLEGRESLEVEFKAARGQLWLHSLGGSWSEAEQLALVHARQDGEVDNLRLRKLAGLHPSDATRVLSGLRDRGLLQMIGGGRGARYQLGPAATLVPGEVVVPDGDTATKANSEGIRPSPEVKRPSSEGIGASSEGKTLSPEDLWPELQEIAKPARERRRLDPIVRNDILVRLCARVPLSLHELARLLERSEPYLREALRHLIASGRLTFAYPDQPSHPYQRYVAKNVPAGLDAG